MSTNKHGCCADKACNSSTCMELPDGRTCGDCAHLPRCAAFVGRKGAETSCDWFPRRFRLSNARVIEEADADIAAQHPPEPHYLTPTQAPLFAGAYGVEPFDERRARIEREIRQGARQSKGTLPGAPGVPGTGRKLLDEFLTEAEKAGVTHLGVPVGVPGPAHNDHPMRHWDRTCPACNPGVGSNGGKSNG